MKNHIVIYFTASPLSEKIPFLNCASKFSWPIVFRISLSVMSQERSVISIKIPYRTILLLWCGWPGMPKAPKVTKLQNRGKKEVRHKFNFLHEEKN